MANKNNKKTPPKPPARPSMKAIGVGVRQSDEKNAPKTVPVMTMVELANKALDNTIAGIEGRIAILQAQITSLTRQRDALKVQLGQTAQVKK